MTDLENGWLGAIEWKKKRTIPLCQNCNNETDLNDDNLCADCAEDKAEKEREQDEH